MGVQRGNRQLRRALSLLELIAVVAIIGFLAAVVIPRYVTTTGTASSETGVFQISTLNSTIERYYLDKGKFPATLSDLVPDYLPGGVPQHPDPDLAFSYDEKTGRVTSVAR